VFAEGEPVIVLVRPENVRIGDGATAAGGVDSGGISLAGQVKQLTFRGARVSLAVETPVQRLNVESPALLPVREGDSLTLSVPTHGAWAIRPDARRA
jgi:ABC-type Fe3+/spermidine/putrescine transport system ATPase subunit